MKKLQKLLYTTLIATASLMSMQKATGQQDNWQTSHPKPTKIDLFHSQDNTPAAIEYNSLNTRTLRDSFIQAGLNEDWISTMHGRFTPTVFDCNNYTIGLVINSHDFGKDLYFDDVDPFNPLYNNYSGSDTALIYKNGGSLVTEGKLGLPMLGFVFTSNEGNHAMNVIFTGDDLSLESMNRIEPQMDLINIKPGEAYLLKNCEVSIGYNYTYKKDNKTKLGTQILARYTIKDGVASNLRFNPNLEGILVKKRTPGVGVKTTTEQPQIYSYPNPTTGNTTIVYPEGRNAIVRIYNSIGQTLEEITDDDKDGKTKIDLTEKPTGIIIYKITLENKNYTGKILKQ
jgi:hypothetical protein